MEATRVQSGEKIDYTPSGADVNAGDVVLQGDLFGIAQGDIPDGELGALEIEGVFDLTKASGSGVTFSAGAAVYWDDTNDTAVATDGAGAHKQIGQAVEAAADADTTVRTKINRK